jgi:hypothetical protein
VNYAVLCIAETNGDKLRCVPGFFCALWSTPRFFELIFGDRLVGRLHDLLSAVADDSVTGRIRCYKIKELWHKTRTPREHRREPLAAPN